MTKPTPPPGAPTPPPARSPSAGDGLAPAVWIPALILVIGVTTLVCAALAAMLVGGG